MSKHEGKKIGDIRLYKNGQISVGIHGDYLDKLPVCATVILAAAITRAKEESSSRQQIINMLYKVLEAAIDIGEISFDAVDEVIQESENADEND